MTPKPGQVVKMKMMVDGYAPRTMFLHPPSSVADNPIVAFLEDKVMLVVLEVQPHSGPADYWIKCLTANGLVGWLPVNSFIMQLVGVKTP